MISAKDNVTINPRYANKYRWNALYDRSKSFELQEGVVLVYKIGNADEVIFQLGENVNILSSRNTSVKITPGSGVVVSIDLIRHSRILVEKKFALDSCRFPTQAELDYYNTLSTI